MIPIEIIINISTINTLNISLVLTRMIYPFWEIVFAGKIPSHKYEKCKAFARMPIVNRGGVICGLAEKSRYKPFL